ncbi:MAG TPA: DEAD/DEAH box helicase [Polyangiaceae bacterium]
MTVPPRPLKERLAEALASGETDAFSDAVVKELMPKVQASLRRDYGGGLSAEDCEDCVSQAVSRFYERSDGVRVQNPEAYIWQTAKHQAIDMLEERARLREACATATETQTPVLGFSERAAVQLVEAVVDGVDVELLVRVQQPGVASEMLDDFPGRASLDPHQVEAVAAITHPDVTGICVFDEQGLGKTVTTLFSFHRLRQLGAVTCMLVVAPKNMVLEWARDTERFFGSLYSVAVATGFEREKRIALDRPADIYVTNFETTVSLEVRLRQLLSAEKGLAMLVVDESFFVKSTQARRTSSVKALRAQVGKCVVLCGTPAPNSPHDLVEQFNIADGGVAFDGVRLPPEREAARPVVQERIETRGVYLRRLKQDVMPHLPAKTFNRILVPMEPVQERAYGAALQQLVKELNSVDDVTFKRRIASFLAQRAALLQICSHPGSLVEGYQETPAKVLALDSVLDELVLQRREKVILWSFFTFSLGTLIERYARFNPVRCDGSVSRAEDRREAVRRFQEDDETMLFVGNPAAAGAGLTLHRARYAIYESMSNQAAHYLQSLDRIHRRGQERPVEYLVLLCDRSIEVTEYDRLIAKESAAQDLLGDQVTPPLTRLSMLQEAEAAATLLGTREGGPPCRA